MFTVNVQTISVPKTIDIITFKKLSCQILYASRLYEVVVML